VAIVLLPVTPLDCLTDLEWLLPLPLPLSLDLSDLDCFVCLAELDSNLPLEGLQGCLLDFDMTGRRLTIKILLLIIEFYRFIS